MPSKKLNKAAVTALNITAVKKKYKKLYKVFCDGDECKKEDFNQGGIAEIRAVMNRAQIDYDKWLKNGKNKKKITLDKLKKNFPLVELVELGAFAEEITEDRSDKRPISNIFGISSTLGTKYHCLRHCIRRI